MIQTGSQFSGFGLPANLSGGPDVFWLAAAALAVVLSIPWFFMPFALFGLKKRLDRIGRSLDAIERAVPRGPRLGEDIPLSAGDRDLFASVRRS